MIVKAPCVEICKMTVKQYLVKKKKSKLHLMFLRKEPWLQQEKLEKLSKDRHSDSQVVLVVKNLPGKAGDTRDTGFIPGLRGSPGGRSGNSLQYSCLGNPMDRGAWQATVHKVAKVWTWLNRHDWTERRASLIAQLIKNLPAMQETLVRFLGWEGPLEKG